MATLSTKQRRDMASDHFAVPGKKALPINDAHHVRLAWSMVDRTGGLTPGERAQARQRIKRRAHELGIDTTDWQAEADNDFAASAVDMFTLSAMAIEVPEVDGHPNRVPFSGVLTIVDEPSDNPPGGSKGKRVLIPKEVAEEALSSLLLMGVDYSDNLSEHDPTQKIGVITSAEIVGNELRIAGFLYGADFPAVVAELQELKDKLGFSYECKVAVKDWKASVLEVSRVVFTGAAVLFKDKAAYTTTSFEASAASEENSMTREEMEQLMASAIANAVDPIKAENEALKAHLAGLSGLQAAAAVRDAVAGHVAALHAAADAMCAAGIGNDPANGHAVHVRKIASHLEASAVLGRVPQSYDGGYLHAGADKSEELEKAQADLAAAADQLAGKDSEIAELKAAAFKSSQAPERKTEAGIVVKNGDGKDAKTLDIELKASGAGTQTRFAAMLERMFTDQAEAA